MLEGECIRICFVIKVLDIYGQGESFGMKLTSGANEEVLNEMEIRAKMFCL